MCLLHIAHTSHQVSRLDLCCHLQMKMLHSSAWQPDCMSALIHKDCFCSGKFNDTCYSQKSDMQARRLQSCTKGPILSQHTMTYGGCSQPCIRQRLFVDLTRTTCFISCSGTPPPPYPSAQTTLCRSTGVGRKLMRNLWELILPTYLTTKYCSR